MPVIERDPLRGVMARGALAGQELDGFAWRSDRSVPGSLRLGFGIAHGRLTQRGLTDCSLGRFGFLTVRDNIFGTHSGFFPASL
jgi:hypothetical protein